ncbi:RNA polymerase sigma factor [Pseudonocardia sp. TRM90224]|uniref:RNA polymerase sigma factor n=1 Tax=Pseudonocardia sp. TRM90224 TaxID=2812678 RepID=UPI001E5B4E30|nr:sigma-70 family RNA polymerase sigma factor [Pseudonocardia sp. TRM90224]
MTTERAMPRAGWDRSPPDPAVLDPAFPDTAVARIGSDRHALDQLYRAHVDDVISYLARRCPDPHDVADLTADTFVTAIDTAHRFDPRRGRPVAWLLGVARHVLLRHFRTRATERRAVARISGRRLLDTSDIHRLEERIDAERRAQRLLGDLDRLSAREREVVELVDRAGLTTAEAAQALGVTTGVVRIRRHRAHTRLRTSKGPSDVDV